LGHNLGVDCHAGGLGGQKRYPVWTV